MDARATLQRLEAEAGAACMGCGMVREARTAAVLFEARVRVRVTCAACAAGGAYPPGCVVAAEQLLDIGALACACGAAAGLPGAGGMVRVTAAAGGVVDREVRCGPCCARLVQRIIDNASRSSPPPAAPAVAPDPDGLRWVAPDVVARLAAAAEGVPCATCPALVGTGPAMVPGNVGLVLRAGHWHALAFCTACAGAAEVEASGTPATQRLLARAAARRPS